MTLPPQTKSALAAMPNGVASLLIEPSSTVLDAGREATAAATDYNKADQDWRRRLFIVQSVIAAALFLKWLGQHALVSAAIMAFLAFLALTGLQVFTRLFTGTAKRRTNDAQVKLAAARQTEVEHNLASLRRGRYRWIRQGSEYLAVFTDAGLLYHFGSASRDRHWMLNAGRTVHEVRVTTRTSTSQTATSSTTHGRRIAYAPTSHIAVLGKGRSTTSTETKTIVTTSHALEIQVQPEAGAQPSWITIPFGVDGRAAEDWKLLVEQLRS